MRNLYTEEFSHGIRTCLEIGAAVRTSVDLAIKKGLRVACALNLQERQDVTMIAHLQSPGQTRILVAYHLTGLVTTQRAKKSFARSVLLVAEVVLFARRVSKWMLAGARTKSAHYF